MGWHLDGRVTAVLGTHTHIPTADERVLPGGTAYQTDVGMSGPYDSVIGVEKELVLKKFPHRHAGKFEAAKGNPKMCAALVTCESGSSDAIPASETKVRQYRQMAKSRRRPPKSSRQSPISPAATTWTAEDAAPTRPVR
jgi:calcineurin-like phosphoesterase